MAQVVVFFGWLVVGIAITLVVFGHVSIVFVYGVDTLLETLWPEQGMTSLVYSAASLIPGAILVSIGKVMKKAEAKTAASENAENA